jgi:DNA-binding response OmpR family regulator
MPSTGFGDGDGTATARGAAIDLTRSAEPFCLARFVVIDDDDANVHLLTRVLHVAGATDIHGITDPDDAVAACLALRPDVVFLDLHLGHLDGYGVLEQLRAADGRLEVIVLSGETRTEARDRALAAGARDFVTKPFDIADVLRRVRAVLDLVDFERT